jgi:hypothetical protein
LNESVQPVSVELSRDAVGTTDRTQLQKIDGFEPILAHHAPEGARALNAHASREQRVRHEREQSRSILRYDTQSRALARLPQLGVDQSGTAPRSDRGVLGYLARTVKTSVRFGHGSSELVHVAPA